MSPKVLITLPLLKDILTIVSPSDKTNSVSEFTLSTDARSITSLN
ncbi:hypothetical protein [Sulfurisphaera tokodaii]|nr:hypothetical protein [Sulfurisphaera tokodaii]